MGAIMRRTVEGVKWEGTAPSHRKTFNAYDRGNGGTR